VRARERERERECKNNQEKKRTGSEALTSPASTFLKKNE